MPIANSANFTYVGYTLGGTDPTLYFNEGRYTQVHADATNIGWHPLGNRACTRVNISPAGVAAWRGLAATDIAAADAATDAAAATTAANVAAATAAANADDAAAAAAATAAAADAAIATATAADAATTAVEAECAFAAAVVAGTYTDDSATGVLCECYRDNDGIYTTHVSRARLFRLADAAFDARFDNAYAQVILTAGVPAPNG